MSIIRIPLRRDYKGGRKYLLRRLLRRTVYALIPGANPYVPIREIIRPKK